MAKKSERRRQLEGVLDRLRRSPGALKASELRVVGTVIMAIEDAMGIPGEPAHRQIMADLGGPLRRFW